MITVSMLEQAWPIPLAYPARWWWCCDSRDALRLAGHHQLRSARCADAVAEHFDCPTPSRWWT